MLCGFKREYEEMLSAFLGGDFILCTSDAQIIIADEDAAISEKSIPVIVLGKSEGKRKNKVFIRRPVSLAALRQTALSLVSQLDAPEKAPEALTITPENLSVSFGGKTVSLTPLEFRLFSMLYASKEPLPREAVRAELWPSTEDSNIVDVYICYLRKKLEGLFGQGFIVSLRGKGYILRSP